jgi:hypothetical protein
MFVGHFDFKILPNCVKFERPLAFELAWHAHPTVRTICFGYPEDGEADVAGACRQRYAVPRCKVSGPTAKASAERIVSLGNLPPNQPASAPLSQSTCETPNCKALQMTGPFQPGAPTGRTGLWLPKSSLPYLYELSHVFSTFRYWLSKTTGCEAGIKIVSQRKMHEIFTMH